MKVDKLIQLLDEKFIQSPNYGMTVEVINRDINTDKFRLQYQIHLINLKKSLLRILGTPFKKGNGETIWNIIVDYDYFERPCQIIYMDSSDSMGVWARNEDTALDVKDLILELHHRPSKTKEIELPKTTKPKVEID